MGKGDRKTRKGKISIGSYGNTRKRKKRTVSIQESTTKKATSSKSKSDKGKASTKKTTTKKSSSKKEE